MQPPMPPQGWGCPAPRPEMGMQPPMPPQGWGQPAPGMEMRMIQPPMQSQTAPAQNIPSQTDPSLAGEKEADGNKVESPLVGTFYSASSPDAEPFVKKGDTVKKGQVLGIVEAMKLMNEIECEFDGVVADILVNNGDMVEYGQPLFIIK
jgi:acetyl-CoA carboxylase biotin carboxyl carrier protein